MTEPRDRHWSSLLRPDNAEPETCDHQWVHKAGAGYRATPVAICVKCHAEKSYCAKCGVRPDDLG